MSGEEVELHRDIEFGFWEPWKNLAGSENGRGRDGGLVLARTNLISRLGEIMWFGERDVEEVLASERSMVHIDRCSERAILGALDQSVWEQTLRFKDGWVGVEAKGDDLLAAVMVAEVGRQKKARLVSVAKDDTGYEAYFRKWNNGEIVTVWNLSADRDLWYMRDSNNASTTTVDVGSRQVKLAREVKQLVSANGRYGNDVQMTLGRLTAHVYRRAGRRQARLEGI